MREAPEATLPAQESTGTDEVATYLSTYLLTYLLTAHRHGRAYPLPLFLEGVEHRGELCRREAKFLHAAQRAVDRDGATVQLGVGLGLHHVQGKWGYKHVGK